MIMKNKAIILNLLFLFLTQWVWAQARPSVTVTVQVLPPYSTYVSDYVNSPNKVVFTLLSTSNVSIRLKASIKGDNGISVATSNSYKPATPLNLTAYQQKMLTGLDLKNYLDFNSAVVTGINKNDLFRGSGIPEGIYTLCIQALDYNTGEILSNEEPLGCSNSFSIEQLSPPQLITPRCDEPILANSIQNVIFTWLPPAGVPVGSQYKLKIVELNPNSRNPNEAMNSATTPAFFETTTSSFSVVYGPNMPPLKKGKKYAWRVTLLPGGGRANANTVALNIQNKGNSEVCSFEYKETEVALPNVSNEITLLQPSRNAKINNGDPIAFSWKSNLKSVHHYQLQFTDRISQNTKITNWNALSESLFANPGGFYASKDVGNTTNYQLPSSFSTSNGKMAWRIVALDASNTIIAKSAIEIYEIVAAANESAIVLVSPIKGEKIKSGYGLKLQWEASKKKNVIQYELQFTDSYSQSKKITDWSTLPESIFTNKDAFFVSKQTKELFIDLPISWTNGPGKIAWRVVGLDANKAIVDKSAIETYEIVEDKSDLAQLKNLIINGYNLQVTQIGNKDQDKFSGSGKILLWEGGKEVSCNFKDLKIRPIQYSPKTKKYQWAVIDGNIEINTKGMSPNNKINLITQKDCDGTFQLLLNSMSLTANLEGSMDSKNEIFNTTKDSGKTFAKVGAKWYSNFFIWEKGASSSNKQYEFETASDGTLEMSFKDKFKGSVILKNIALKNLENSGIAVDFDPIAGITLNVNGLEGETSISGKVKVPNANPGGSTYLTTMGILEIPFKNQKNLNFRHTFDKPLSWKINDDGSVWANVKETYVHLSDNGQIESKFETYNNGLNFDKFGLEVKLPQKNTATSTPLSLNFDKVYNKGAGYTTNTKPGTEAKNKGDIAGFASKLKKSSFMIVKNKLVYLNIEGDLFVPFVNDWAGVTISIDSKKIQEIYLSFDYDKKYYLFKKQTGNYAYITVWAGKLEGNSIVISPNLTIKNNENKGLEAQDMSMCDLYIDASGAVSYNGNFADNSESVCEGSKKWATYYRFSYGIDKMKIKRNTIKNDAQFLFSGDVVLGPNIATKDKKEMGFVYHGIEPKPNMIDYGDIDSVNPNQTTNPNLGNGIGAPKGVKKGPLSEEEYFATALESTLEISDDGKSIQGGYEDGAQKYGGGFKIVQDDPTWGNYFQLEGNYVTKQPETKELQSKLILGKTQESNGKYTYWFFEFKQKGFVTVPIIPGILETNAFGGKAYYHIEPTFNNLGQITSMKPNNTFSLGILAEADIRTSYDLGKTMHGHVQLVTQFKGWSIDGISYYIYGDGMAENGESPGMIKARLNGQMNWIDKYIDGKGQIWGKVKDLVCLNEGQANDDSIFFHFGADDFYLKVGTKEKPISAEVMCGSGMKMGVWFGFDKKQVALGFTENYDSGWKGLDLGVASAEGRLTSVFSADVSVQYWPFKATGNASFNGRAYGKGCVDFWAFDGCISGSCGVAANLSVTLPNPTAFEGSVVCDVHKWIPNFTLHAKWSSNGGFAIWL